MIVYKCDVIGCENMQSHTTGHVVWLPPEWKQEWSDVLKRKIHACPRHTLRDVDPKGLKRQGGEPHA